jgi:ABC-type multidrug transport system ATPase subunit
LRDGVEPPPTVEVRDLRRVYKTTIGVLRRRVKEVVAVEGISFDVAPGELLRLLGPNGAGKTTTVKMLTTLVGELGLGVLYILLGYSLFRWFEFQAKRRGTLEAF